MINVRLQGRTMGTIFEIIYLDPAGRNFRSQLEQIFEEINQCFSLYKEHSEISSFNQNGHLENASDHFLNVFDKAKSVHDKSEGYYNPAVYPEVIKAGFGPELNPAFLMHPYSVDFNNVKRIERSVTSEEKTPLFLDFNAIAKGYAVDLAANFLMDKGIGNFLINIGGDLRTGGLYSNRKWRIKLLVPAYPNFPDSYTCAFEISDISMATSGGYLNYKSAGNKIITHLASRSGKSFDMNRPVSITVATKKCYEADAWATALAIMDVQKMQELSVTLKKDSIYVFALFRVPNEQGFETWNTCEKYFTD